MENWHSIGLIQSGDRLTRKKETASSLPGVSIGIVNSILKAEWPDSVSHMLRRVIVHRIEKNVTVVGL